MGKNNIIKFDSKQRIMDRAKAYAESLELFMAEQEKAIPILLKSLKYADLKTAHKILLILGNFAREETVEPIYNIMTDPNTRDEIRSSASTQLNTISPLLEDPEPLIDKLLEDIKSPDPDLRVHVTFALGWEGNDRAIVPLIELLYDDNIDVQQAAVNAISNLRDDRILDLLLDRLKQAGAEQKRCILYNLWRFSSKHKKVEEVYLEYMDHEDDDIRFDAVVLLETVSEHEKHISSYCKAMKDRDTRIRKLAVERLGEIDAGKLSSIREHVENLIKDPDKGVRQAALNLLKRIKE